MLHPLLWFVTGCYFKLKIVKNLLAIDCYGISRIQTLYKIIPLRLSSEWIKNFWRFLKCTSFSVFQLLGWKAVESKSMGKCFKILLCISLILYVHSLQRSHLLYIYLLIDSASCSLCTLWMSTCNHVKIDYVLMVKLNDFFFLPLNQLGPLWGLHSALSQPTSSKIPKESYWMTSVWHS